MVQDTNTYNILSVLIFYPPPSYDSFWQKAVQLFLAILAAFYRFACVIQGHNDFVLHAS